MKPNHFAGFSIFEMLVLLCLLSGLVAWAGLQVEQLVSKQLLQRTGTALDSVLEHQALEAISKRHPVFLIFDQAAGTVSETAELPDNRGANSPSSLIYVLPRGIRFTDIRLPRLKNQQPHLEFSADGTATPGTITLAGSPAGRSCSLVQALGGRRSLSCKKQ